jgi:hypothetical protein
MGNLASQNDDPQVTGGLGAQRASTAPGLYRAEVELLVGEAKSTPSLPSESEI